MDVVSILFSLIKKFHVKIVFSSLTYDGMILQGGMYVFHLLDSYAAGTSILFLGITEVFVIGWLYGKMFMPNSHKSLACQAEHLLYM